MGTFANIFQNNTASSAYTDIDPITAAKELSRFRIVDVREEGEYFGPMSHIDRAELVPMGTVAEHSKHWDKNEEILLICRSGGRSANVAMFLASQGFKNLYNLAGGMMMWERHGLGSCKDGFHPEAQGALVGCQAAAAV